MGNKESQMDGKYTVDGRDSQVFDPILIKSFTDLADNDAGVTLENFQIVRILSNLHQYRILSSLYEKTLRKTGNFRFSWLQFALSLISDHRVSHMSKILHQFLTLSEVDPIAFDENIVIGYMQLVRLHIECLGDLDFAERLAMKLINHAQDTWLSGRCFLLLAIVYSLKAQQENSFESNKKLMWDCIMHFEKAIELDPHDDVAHLYCALEYAKSRDLVMARERCQMALNLNLENPFAFMLMALIFTARKDYKGALELVINALTDFPSNYGLLVLRLKLESKYGRVEEALQTSRNLIYFWRKNRPTFECFGSEDESAMPANGAEIAAGPRLSTNLCRQNMGSKEAMVPLTPLLTAPLGISATTPTHLSVLATPNCDITPCSSNDNISTVGPTTTQMSETGAAASTDSLSMLTSSSKSWISFSAFRMQADIWVELAEFFIEMDRLNDVQACVEEACAIYPRSHQALYLKGHLYLRRAEKLMDRDPVLSRKFRDEAKNCLLATLSMCTAHCPSYFCLSKIYYMDGNLMMSEKMLRELMVMDPLNFQSWHELGRILAELGRNEEALEAFQTSAILDANTPLIPFKTIPILSTNINMNIYYLFCLKIEQWNYFYRAGHHQKKLGGGGEGTNIPYLGKGLEKVNQNFYEGSWPIFLRRWSGRQQNYEGNIKPKFKIFVFFSKTCSVEKNIVHSRLLRRQHADLSTNPMAQGAL